MRLPCDAMTLLAYIFLLAATVFLSLVDLFVSPRPWRACIWAGAAFVLLVGIIRELVRI